MGRKKDYERAMQQMMAMFQQAQQPSAVENQYQSEWSNLGNWLNAKDYRNLPAGAVVDLLPAAEYQRMRKMVQGSDAGHQGAKGSNMAGIANAQRELGNNQFLQDYGGAYEQKVGELSNRRDALGNVLMSSDANRKQIGVQGSQAYLQALNNKPRSMWSQLIPNLIGAGANIAGQFA